MYWSPHYNQESESTWKLRHATNIENAWDSPPERAASQHSKFQTCNETKIPSDGAETKSPEGDYTHNERYESMFRCATKYFFSMLRFRMSGMSAIYPQFRGRTRGKMARVEIFTEECNLTTTQTSAIRYATKQFPQANEPTQFPLRHKTLILWKKLRCVELEVESEWYGRCALESVISVQSAGSAMAFVMGS